MSGKHIFLFLFILISLNLQAQPGGCLYFSGQDQYVLVPHSASLEMSVFGQMTAEAWIKPSAIGPGERIIMQKSDTSWGLYLLNGIPVFRVTDTLMHQAVAQHPLDSGRWHHLAGTFDGTTLCLWVNGCLAGTATAGYIRNAANQELRLGGKPSVQSSCFLGWMDEVRIWRRALSARELRLNIHRPLPLSNPPQGLSAYYTFDQDSGILLPDLTPLLNNGLLTNMDTTGGPGSNWRVSTAPLPFSTIAHGEFHQDSLWPSDQGAPQYPWARVMIDHMVDLYGRDTLESLTVNANADIDIHPGAGLTVSGLLVSIPGQPGIILRSDSSSSGSLIHSTPGVAATILHYLTADTWHHFSTPVSTALTGIFSGLWLLPYNEPAGTWGNYITQTGMLLTPARGYATWSSSAYTGNHTLYVLGLMNQGDVTSPVLTNSAADPIYRGFNFTGNPYPSGIDWEADGWVRTNIGSALYVYDAQRQNYRTYVNGTGVNGGNRYIAPMQGFFVRVRPEQASGLIGFSDATREHPPLQPPGAGSVPELPSIALRAENPVTGFYDETRLNFGGSWAPGNDPLRDATKLFSGSANVPQLWSLTPDSSQIPMAINHLGDFLDPVAIPLCFQPQSGGSFRLSLQEINSIGSGTSLILEDLINQSNISLRDSNEILFSAQANDTTHRFLLHINPTGFSGRLVYHKSGLPGLEGAGIQVIPDIPSIDTVRLSTTSGGVFVHPWPDTGSYILQANLPAVADKGSVNAVDALLIARAQLGLHSLDSLQALAADVNGDGSIGTDDALMVARWFADLVPSFSAGEWRTERPEVKVQGQDVTGLLIKALLTGDVNGSYHP